MPLPKALQGDKWTERIAGTVFPAHTLSNTGIHITLLPFKLPLSVKYLKRQQSYMYAYI
jgi:hypothetical protein